MPRVGPLPVGFRFADGKAHFEVVVPKTGGRVRRRRTIDVESLEKALEFFHEFEGEARAKFKSLEALAAAATVGEQGGPKSTNLIGVDEELLRKVLTALERMPATASPTPSQGGTFGTYIAAHLDNVCGRVRPKTATSYRQFVVNHLLPYFGEKPLADITIADVRDFQGHLLRYRSPHRRWKGQSLSPASINGCLRVLRLLLGDAYDRRLIGEVPGRGKWVRQPVEELRLEATDDERQRFLRAFDDEAAFRARIEANRDARPFERHTRRTKFRAYGGFRRPEGDAAGEIFDRFSYLKPLFVACFESGLRRGDLLGLVKASVRLDEGFIRVTMQKTRRVAEIAISPACRAALEVAMARSGSSPFVFTDVDGEPISPTTFARAFATAKAIAGITRRFRPHDARHTFASRLASKGVSLQVIARALGHKTTVLTERYAKPNTAALRQVASALAEDDPDGSPPRDSP